MTTADVRVASFDELDVTTAYALWRLRQEVFVVEQDCPYLDLDGRDLEPGTRHIWVADGTHPVGYLRVLEDLEAARIGRVLVASHHRGRGHAARLMQHALRHVGDRASVLDAQTYLAGWYEGFGYVATGPEFLDDGIPHLPMRRDPVREPEAFPEPQAPTAD